MGFKIPDTETGRHLITRAGSAAGMHIGPANRLRGVKNGEATKSVEKCVTGRLAFSGGVVKTKRTQVLGGPAPPTSRFRTDSGAGKREARRLGQGEKDGKRAGLPKSTLIVSGRVVQKFDQEGSLLESGCGL